MINEVTARHFFMSWLDNVEFVDLPKKPIFSKVSFYLQNEFILPENEGKIADTLK